MHFFQLLFHKKREREIMDRIKYLIENPFCLLLSLIFFPFDVHAKKTQRYT